MPTTIHIPERLLQRVDAQARSLGTSRNRVILDAIEASIGAQRTWPPNLVRMLAQPLDRDAAADLARSLAAVRSKRANRRRAADM